MKGLRDEQTQTDKVTNRQIDVYEDKSTEKDTYGDRETYRKINGLREEQTDRSTAEDICS